LPAVHQSQPKSFVAGVASVNGKAAAFIGTSPEMFYTHLLLTSSLPTGSPWHLIFLAAQTFVSV
jgi:hypothetical protein